MNAVLYTGLIILTRHQGDLERGRAGSNRLHIAFGKVLLRGEDIDKIAADNPLEPITVTVKE